MINFPAGFVFLFVIILNKWKKRRFLSHDIAAIVLLRTISRMAFLWMQVQGWHCHPVLLIL